MAFALIGSVTPGGSTLFSSSSGSRFGFRRSLPLLAGLVTGFCLLTFAAGVGFATVIHSVHALRLVIKIAGAAYLLWLAWHIATSGVPDTENRGSATPGRFRTGIIFNLLNPKAWTVVVSATAAYSALTENTLLFAVVFVAIWGTCCTLACILWCAFGHSLGRLISTERQWRIVNGCLAVLLALTIIPMWLE